MPEPSNPQTFDPPVTVTVFFPCDPGTIVRDNVISLERLADRSLVLTQAGGSVTTCREDWLAHQVDPPAPARGS